MTKEEQKMIVHIANPIYDSVFKYLMEDERIAKTILSALLKKEVVSITARPHEYANEARDKISMFRIDFAANVREDDGKEHLILVELQKTWLETETLRFRQYLGAQYSNKRNINKNSHEGYAIPMVTIYLLGHRVGDIDVPVVYVNHKSYDYDGNVVTKGMPDPFIESLVHNSIIVQIPLLHGQINNRLDKVLSVFDQTKADSNDPHVLSLDEKNYEGDDSMEYIVHRLTQAAADADMRQNMNVEDEYYSAIENRDTAIMNRDKKIKEQDKLLAENAKLLAENAKLLSENEKSLAEQDKLLAEQEKSLAEHKKSLAEQNKMLVEKEKSLAEKDNKIISMAKALLDKGMSPAQVAGLVGISGDELRQSLHI